MPSTVFRQPTESQAIPVHELGTVLSFAGSGSKLCLKNGQGLAVISPSGALFRSPGHQPANVLGESIPELCVGGGAA